MAAGSVQGRLNPPAREEDDWVNGLGLGILPANNIDTRGGGGGGSSSNAPINVQQRIAQGRRLLTNNCKSKFTQTIPGYTTSRFFDTLSQATINQYPTATPPQDTYGADATTHAPNGPIDLLPNFYGLSTTIQSFVLIHEGIHLFGRGALGDTTVQNLFGLPVGGDTDNITQYIAGGCEQ